VTLENARGAFHDKVASASCRWEGLIIG
jgi:hypothetical protein